MAFQQYFDNGEDGIDVRTILSFWINPIIIDRDLTAPPGGESNGDAYIVGGSATGAWSGQDGNIALYLANESGYIFETPQEGMTVRIADEDLLLQYTGTIWGEIPVQDTNGDITLDGDLTTNNGSEPYINLAGGRVNMYAASSTCYISNRATDGALTFQTSGLNNALTLSSSQNATIWGNCVIKGDFATVGQDNTAYAILYLYGDTTASTSGGELRLYTAADHDTNVDFYKIRGFQDDLQITDDVDDVKIAITYEGNVILNQGASGATADADGDDLIVENSGDAGMSILGGTTSNCTINFGDSGDANIGYINYDNNDNTMLFGAGATNHIKFDGSGNVGIGVSTVQAKLHVGGTTADFVAKFTSTDATSAIQFNDSASTKVVGIGATGDALVFFHDASGGASAQIDSSGNFDMNTAGGYGHIKRSTSAGITASTTQSQGQQPLTRDINEVSTVGNTNDVVTLPTAAAGLEIRVINNGANTLQIYPASGDAIDGGSVDASVTLASGNKVTYVAYDATNWESF